MRQDMSSEAAQRRVAKKVMSIVEEENAGVFDENEVEIIRNIFTYGDKDLSLIHI